MTVGMGHQLVRLLASCVETQGVIDVMVYRKWHGGVGAIGAGTTGIDEDMGEADDVAVYVGERLFDGVFHE